MELVRYVTSSPFKVEENDILRRKGSLSDGVPISTLFEFEILALPVGERLLVDLSEMVTAEAMEAYHRIKVPCIVEHAGLVFEQFEAASYPGGLTKPMWDTLGERFVEETHSANRRAIARAVVAYCDGQSVQTFVGETRGSIASHARGGRSFYWDTVFVPDTSGAPAGLTYSEIAEHPDYGLEYKVLTLSQSTRAMLAFLEHLRLVGSAPLWA